MSFIAKEQVYGDRTKKCLIPYNVLEKLENVPVNLIHVLNLQNLLDYIEVHLKVEEKYTYLKEKLN